MKEVKLWQIAHSRAGDKGRMLNLSLIPYNSQHYELLKEKVTSQTVKSHFGFRVQGKVTRYELPKIFALNFTLENCLPSGVSSSLTLDPHGKTLSSLLLELTITMP